MKKLMMMAMLLMATTSIFAAKSEALKAIMKTKVYTEAQALVNSTLDQLASNEEKAQAYNHVAQLAYDAYKHESDIEETNRTLQKNDPVDEQLKLDAALCSILNAIECDKYDQLPNEKNKVKMQFREKNQGTAPFLRQELIVAAQKTFQANDYTNALKYAAAFIDCSQSTLLTSNPQINPKDNLGIAAYFASLSAYNLKEMDKVAKYARIGVTEGEEEVSKYCFNLLLASYKSNDMTTAADTAKYIDNMKALYAEYPEKENVFTSLIEVYINANQNDAALKLADERIAQYPESTIPHAYKGNIYMNMNEYEKAIEAFGKIPEDDKNYLLSIFNIGLCYNNMATELNNKLSDSKTNTITKENAEKVKDIQRKTKEYLEKVWNKDPQFQRSRLVYYLYSVYYNLGENEKSEEMQKIMEAEK